MPLTEKAFGLVIVTVIVVVDVPPTTTVEGLNDFDIVSGSVATAKRVGAHARMSTVRTVESTWRRRASIGEV
jgi:hypothetical protein